MSDIYRFDSASFQAGSTGCPYRDLEVGASHERAGHLIALLAGRDAERAEAAADVLQQLVSSHDIQPLDFHRLQEVLDAGPNLTDSCLADAWQSLQSACEHISVGKVKERTDDEVPVSLSHREFFSRSGTDERPVLIPGIDDSVGVFSLSGLHASGYPLLRGMNHLSKLTGFTVQVNALPGHGVPLEGYTKASHAFWVERAEQEARDFGAALQFPKVVGVGFSTGGLVLTSIAEKHPELFSALVLINAPFSLRRRKHQFQLLMGSLGSSAAHVFPALNRLEFSVPKPRSKSSKLERKNPSPNTSPLQPYGAFRRSVLAGRKALPALKVPTLIITSGKDRVADTPEIHELVRESGSQNLTLHTVDTGTHMLPLTDSGKFLASRIHQFLRRNGIVGSPLPLCEDEE